MNYPKTRLRRLRYNKNVRSLFEDVSVSKSDLIQPVFLVDGKNIKKEIKSLSGQFQLEEQELQMYEQTTPKSH